MADNAAMNECSTSNFGYPDQAANCPAVSCENPFKRVVVSYLVRQGTLIAWELASDFGDTGPYRFQVQVGKTANQDADDWTDVGLEIVDQFAALDDTKRVYGKHQWTHYRVMLTTAKGIYYSEPTGLLGTLPKRDWLKVRELVRQALVNLKQGHWGQPGFLLKRRVTGRKCQNCIDFVAQAVSQADCPHCYGTGFECGYYYPIECVWAGLEPASQRLQNVAARGTVADKAVQSLFVTTGLGVLIEEDVWVSLRTDDRYFVHTVTPTVQVRGVPVLYNVDLRLIPYTSSIYNIDVPQQLAAVTQSYLQGVAA